MPVPLPDRVKVIGFDVFGTVVDWHGSIAREVQAISPGIDGGAFALAWRAGYWPAMARVRRGEPGWTKLDVLHRQILDEILPRFGLDGLDEAAREHLNLAWHRLDPWPDAVAGLARLKRRLRDLPAVQRQHRPAGQHGQARRAALGPASCRPRCSGTTSPTREPTWACPTSSTCSPREVMLVAAHQNDLRRRAGLRAAHRLRRAPARVRAPAAARTTRAIRASTCTRPTSTTSPRSSAAERRPPRRAHFPRPPHGRLHRSRPA